MGRLGVNSSAESPGLPEGETSEGSGVEENSGVLLEEEYLR